ncbi:MAG: Argininosuccinate lyase [Candidatus Woesebacteria bacterium GW2011_GWB1_38_5b]|uniref:Argininosuccinate lyase n=1 Tax=Candidatus Woesebacteria bacterium GW2011_GWB1_38_5b TaxID=1618569 RepID=A0A0G0K5V5_9BACT|nr:MAG: Argininosuccinate lyase [Candidatus Woesebacteria bacterium GW2011_GWB1_38_5b]
MTKKLWQKTNNNTLEKVVESYTAGEDLVYDQKLVAWDVVGSIAHAKMLLKIGILTDNEYKQLHNALKEIYKKYQSGKFALKVGDEDVHTRVENEVTTKFPSAGAKLHTARSRNDQVLTDMRLYAKDEIVKTALLTYELTQEFVGFAKKYEFAPMPGYTHMQQAMLSSVGLWATQFAESLLDDLAVIEVSYKLNDQSPLGAGAAYGVSLPIDREYSAMLLGFSKVQTNSLYTQNSRGKIESLTAQALVQTMLTLGRFATDLLLFTTAEFDFFSLPDSLTTGSSIMPQKKNVDIMELVRARSKIIQHYAYAISDLITAIPSGYNRDTQEIKPLLMKSFDIVQSSLAIATLVVKNMKPKTDNMKKAITKDLYAAHHSYQFVKKGMAFREAYKKVGSNLVGIPDYIPEEVLKETNHLGAAGNLDIKSLDKQLLSTQEIWLKKKADFERIVSKLLK